MCYGVIPNISAKLTWYEKKLLCRFSMQIRNYNPNAVKLVNYDTTLWAYNTTMNLTHLTYH